MEVSDYKEIILQSSKAPFTLQITRHQFGQLTLDISDREGVVINRGGPTMNENAVFQEFQKASQALREIGQ